MTLRQKLIGIISLIFVTIIYIVPFLFIIINSFKTAKDASQPSFNLPEKWVFWQNLRTTVETRDYSLLLAYWNSTVITVGAVTLLVILGAMVGFVLQRRPNFTTRWVYRFVLAGLMIPPAVVPTIWLLQEINLFKTLNGMILIQVAYGMGFTVLMYYNFVGSIPRELDEAAIIDGAKPLQVFFRVILPLLKPVTLTIIVVQSITIFNDFTHPLYYLPGRDNITVQLTLYNFQSQFNSQLNLLFMNILLITIPPLIVFIFFNRQIVAGMTAGAVKG
jgi:raffinose/stachyose/melibiose transport system permease protein